MPNELSMRAATTPEDLARLREFIGTRGAAVGLLDQHLAGPRYRPALTRLAERDGMLAGCALLSHRRLQLSVATIDTGAIDFFAAPDDEPSLIALLGDCLGALVDQGLPLAMLRGNTAAFAPFGFASFCFATTTWLPAAGVGTAAALRPVDEDDLDDLAALYAASYHGLPLAEARAAPDWRAWLAAKPGAMALEDSRRRLVAYALVAEGVTDLRIDEAAAADAGAARALLAALRQHARAAEQQRLELALAPGHVVARAALYEGAVTHISAAHDGDDTLLAGIVDLPGLLDALAPAFERRLARSRYAGWNGNIRVEIETERIVLALQDGRAEMIDGSRPADVRQRRGTLTALAQL
jgi:predicted N-acetyltransferase YhbS